MNRYFLQSKTAARTLEVTPFNRSCETQSQDERPSVTYVRCSDGQGQADSKGKRQDAQRAKQCLHGPVPGAVPGCLCEQPLECRRCAQARGQGNRSRRGRGRRGKAEINGYDRSLP